LPCLDLRLIRVGFFLIPSGCISICSRSGNGVGSIVGTLVVSFSVKLM
jgi:hypothetical protein